MTELPDWLAREELPTGTFGDARPPRVRPRGEKAVGPDPRALEHRAALLEALGDRPLHIHERLGKKRHLAAVPDTPEAPAA